MEELIEKDCDLCGSQKKTLIATENDYPISRCGNCSLVYVSRIPKIDGGKVIGEYYSGEAEEIEAGRIRYADVSTFLLDEIGKVRSKKGKLLDVGCGYGFFLLKARESGWQVYGTELSNIAVEYMRDRQGLPDVWFADLSDDFLPVEKVDVINLTNVLEHVPSPTKTLRECADLLEKDGVLLIRVPNMNFSRVKQLFIPLIKIFGLGVGGELSYLATEPPIHLTGFTSGTLRKYFSKAGFRTVAVKPSLLSSRVNEHFAYRIFTLFVDLLYKVSFHKINLSPTVLAIAVRSE